MTAIIRAIALLSIVLMFHSCANSFRVAKRHYRPGFYFQKATKPANPPGRKAWPKQQKGKEIEAGNGKLINEPGQAQDYPKETTSAQGSTPKIFRTFEMVKSTGSFMSKTPWHFTGKERVHAPKIKDNSPAIIAKRKSRIYFWIGLGLVILTFSGIIGDFVLLTAPAALFFFTLALINLIRKRHSRVLEKHPEKAKPPKSPEVKTKRAKIWFYGLLALSVLFLILSFANPSFLYLFFIALIPTLIMFFKWKNRYINQKEIPGENTVPQKKKETDDPAVNKARKFGWLAFFWLMMLLISITAAFTGFIIFSIELSGASLLLLINGIILWIISAIYFVKTGAKAYDAGRIIKNQHTGERFYKYKGVGGLARFMGHLSKSTFFVCLLVLAVLVLIGLSLL